MAIEARQAILTPAAVDLSISKFKDESSPFTNAIGKGSDNEGNYAEWGLVTGRQAYTKVYWSFDMSSIPSNATITNVTCSARCSNTNENVIQGGNTVIAIGVGETTKVSSENPSFGKTPTVVTVSDATFTRAELDNFRLKIQAVRGFLSTNASYHTKFYGATLTIDYEVPVEVTTHTVRFLDWNGNVLNTQEIEEGQGATPPTPTRDGYVFMGWDTAYKEITQDTDITAQYAQGTPITDLYQGFIYDGNGSIGEIETEPYHSASVRTGYVDISNYTSFSIQLPDSVFLSSYCMYDVNHNVLSHEVDNDVHFLSLDSLPDGSTYFVADFWYNKGFYYLISPGEFTPVLNYTLKTTSTTQNIYVGNSKIKNIYLGNTSIVKVYLGNILLYGYSTGGAVSSNLWDGVSYLPGRVDDNPTWGEYTGNYTDNWSLIDPYGIQYDITASSMRGFTLQFENLTSGKYLNFTAISNQEVYRYPEVDFYFFDSSKTYLSKVRTGISSDGISQEVILTNGEMFASVLIPDNATCCEMTFKLTIDTPTPYHIEITNINVMEDDSSLY